MRFMEKKIRIAVSGVGGGVGQSILKAFAGSEYEIIALDGDPLAAGLYAASRSYLVPYAASPDYLDKVLAICQQEECSLFFPGLDAELPVLSKASDRFAAIGTRVVVSSPELISLADDKLATYEVLQTFGINVPRTIDMANHDLTSEPPLPFPFILKQRIGGARSRGIHVVKDGEQYRQLLTQEIDLKPYVAQEYIEGDEYTCGSVTLDGKFRGTIVMRRILRDGDTNKCFSVRNQDIEHTVETIANAVKPFGGCNIQLRLKDGIPYVFEINARCSGTTAARALCGFNEPLMIADYLCRGKEPKFSIVEQTVLRYWNELVVPNEAVNSIQLSGNLQQDKHGSL